MRFARPNFKKNRTARQFHKGIFPDKLPYEVLRSISGNLEDELIQYLHICNRKKRIKGENRRKSAESCLISVISEVLVSLFTAIKRLAAMYFSPDFV